MNKRNETITLKGINTTIPDFTVPDGACEELRNLRLRDGAWQKVGNPKLVESIALPDSLYDPDTFSLLYIHEVEGANHYVCEGAVSVETEGNILYQMHLFVYADGAWADLGSYAEHTNLSSLDADIRVTSFGKVLIVTSNGVMQNFVWSDGAYHLFTIPTPVTITEDVSATRGRVSYDKEADRDLFWWDILDLDSKERLLTDNVDQSWWGEICYLVAYRMKDGTILSPSNLRILCSESNVEEEDGEARFYIREVEDKKYLSLRLQATPQSDPTTHESFAESVRLQTFVPSISISFRDVDTNLVDRIAIYATRINPILDYEKMATPTRVNKYHDYYADNNLPNQPFYLVEEVEISTLENNVWETSLYYDKLKDLTTRSQQYIPTQLHRICAETTYDFNHRMHFGNITTTLYNLNPAIEEYHTMSVPNITSCEAYIAFKDGWSVYMTPTITHLDGQESGGWVFPKIVSYPDYRATSMGVVTTRTGGMYGIEDVTLRSATANNFAYYIPDGGEFKYTNLLVSPNGRSTSTKPVASPTFTEPNRIQVSATNNPFSLPFENSYAVGNEGSRVLAMNTIADSLVDSTFYGNYPLYIFTTDGIFALRAGSGEILYLGTENINHDRLIDSTTIALNGSVVYPCVEGLKALSGRTAVRISADIDTNLGIWDDWSGLEMAVNWRFGELYCVKRDGRVFVWNVENGAWSTRDDITGNLRQGYIAEVGNTLAIYNINEEVMSDMSIRFVTRPLKFGSSAFKKIESLIVRLGAREGIQLTCEVYASNDCVDWRSVRSVDLVTDHSFGLRRLEQSARFYRFVLEGNDIINHFTLSQIDFSIQDRYNYKLR